MESARSAKAAAALAGESVAKLGSHAPRRDTPRGSVIGFLVAARAGDYEDAAGYLDLSALPEDQRAELGPVLARHLKFVLDQKLWIDVDSLSELPEGESGDGLSEDRDRVGVIATSRGPIEIRLKRGPDGSGGTQWRFGPSTVEAVPELWDEYGLGWLGDHMPRKLYELRFRDIELWQWIGFVVIGIAAYVLAALLVWAALQLARRRARRTGTPHDNQILKPVRHQVRLVVGAVLFFAASFALRLSVPAHGRMIRYVEIFAVVVFAWMLVKIADVFFNNLRDRLMREGRTSGVAMAVLGRRVAKISILALAGLAVLQQTGFQVTGLVAGLGIGGAAIALASQKTLANLFGGLTLSIDQPIRVGDMCQVVGKQGLVEDVGLRSTRIRTLDRTILSVPNSQLSEVPIENLTMRDQMRLSTMIGLRYETSPDQLRAVLAGLRELLSGHPRIASQPLRVRFVGFGASSLDIEVFAYVTTPDWDAFLEIREELYLRMMDIVAGCGTSIAFPSQTLYMGRDSGLDAGKTLQAEARARADRPPGPAAG